MGCIAWSRANIIYAAFCRLSCGIKELSSEMVREVSIITHFICKPSLQGLAVVLDHSISHPAARSV
jgi:hypothetical protein